MSNQVEPTEAQKPSGVESKKAAAACQDYLRMGVGRSLQKLHQKYIKSTSDEPPTRTLRVLAGWSTKFNWVERAKEYDKAIDAEKNERRREVMEEGLALDYARVTELTELYAALKSEFMEGGLWFTDTKLSAKGDTVDVDVFNKPLIDSLRGVLDDLAKETGGRKQKVEHSGKLDVSKLSDEELLAIIEG